MKRGTLFLFAGALIAGGVVAGLRGIQHPLQHPTSTGKMLTPLDMGVDVGNYPANMTLSPNGRFVVVTDTGYREQLTVLDANTGQIASKLDFNKIQPKREQLYFGVAFGSDGLLYVSRGGEDKISVFSLDANGKLSAIKDIADASAKSDEPNYLGGVSIGRNALYVAHNETYPGGSGTSAVAAIDPANGTRITSYPVGGFPLAVCSITENGADKIFTACERDGCVCVIDGANGGVRQVKTGTNPAYLLPTKDGVWVSNSGSDSVSLIDPGTLHIKKTLWVRPAEVHGLPSCMPLGMAESGGNLFVACGDLNAVAVIDEKSYKLLGYMPVGWLPTSVVVSQDGKHLFVANAKGTKTRTPNPRATAGKGTYILSVLEGTVSMIDLPGALGNLPALSRQVVANNRFDKDSEKDLTPFKNPGIKHVIYVIKENRTYDNVLGDMKEGDGDSSICLFPEEVTPNQHALARRFVLLDNFSVCAEVSADGWIWSTAGQINEYGSRNTPVNYSGRGRDYDEEGEVNGERVDLKGEPYVSAAPGGYIWDDCRKHGVSMRNYGFYVGETDALGPRPDSPKTKVDAPVMKALVGITDDNFREFDMQYPDSEALAKYNFKAPRQMASFGRNGSPNRFVEWKREFDQYVAKGDLPKFIMLRLPRDHTSGTSAGLSSPRAMVADNDYAVGQVVEAVSHSPYWNSTLICVVEDDAQAGLDHIDCHRSPCYIISPFIQKGAHDSRFYNTDSVLHTMELMLGLPPMNGFDATADPIADFTMTPDNAEPYTAILPKREIACEVNTREAYRSGDSAKMIARMHEESIPDVELNDILWGDFKRHRARR